MNKRYQHNCPHCQFLGTYQEYDLYWCSKSGSPIARNSDDPEDVLEGLGFAVSGVLFPLAKALAMAKEKDIYRESQEMVLLPEFDKTLYIVIGETGQGKRFWLVRAFVDRTTAEIFARACTMKAKLWQKSPYKCRLDSPPYNWSKLDPAMQIDKEVMYRIYEVPIAPSPEELDSTWEICPICRGQVYDTPEGRVCENGHDVI